MDKGDGFALGSIFLWSMFPIIGSMMLGSMTPLFIAGISTVCATFIFAAWITYKGVWGEVLSSKAWFSILMATLLIGVIYYILIYAALNSTSVGNVSILLLMEVLFSFLLLGRSEGINRYRILGAIIMMAGAIAILIPKHSGMHYGDALVILAAAIAPVGNYYQQKAREHVGSVTIMFWRSLAGGLVLLAAAFIFENVGSGYSIAFILVNGAILFGIQKILWLEAIHRIPITRAVALGTLAPASTLLMAYMFLAEVPTWVQVSGCVLIITGAMLILYKDKSFIKNPKP
jgi:drug/metabolite transporter (DMT)-like permease